MNAPHITLPKPKIGEPCNRCGLCCSLTTCADGAYVLKLVEEYGDPVTGPCPALVKNKNGTFSCGIVLKPKKYLKKSKHTKDVLSKNFALLIRIGQRCDELIEEDTKRDLDKLVNLGTRQLGNQMLEKKSIRAIEIIHGIKRNV